jgi:hypothetical protein
MSPVPSVTYVSGPDLRSYGAGDGNRTNPNGPNTGVTTRFSVQLESNGVRSPINVRRFRWDREARMFATGAGSLTQLAQEQLSAASKFIGGSGRVE